MNDDDFQPDDVAVLPHPVTVGEQVDEYTRMDAVVQRARRVSTYGLPRDVPRPFEPQMTKNRFVEMWGEGYPPLTLSRLGRTSYLFSGAVMSHDGCSPTYNPPPSSEQDRLLNQISYVKRALYLTEQQLRNVQAGKMQCNTVGVVSYQMADLPWNAELHGPTPIDERGQFDFDRALKSLQVDVGVFRYYFGAFKAALYKVNPNIIIEERFITT